MSGSEVLWVVFFVEFSISLFLLEVVEVPQSSDSNFKFGAVPLSGTIYGI